MDDQTGVGGDAHGFRLVLAGWGNDLHPAADGTATAGQLLDYRCGGTGKELLTQKTFVQAVNHGCRQRRAGHLRSGFPQGDGFIPQLLREILPLLRHIDADADDRAVDGPALGVAGKVVAGEENLIGVTVTAVHEPSGTRYNAVTNVDGRYTIQGMRVGGPYTVTFSYVGYKEESKHNVQLSLGNTEMININMKEDAQALGEVVVTGQAGRGANGPATNFSRAQIDGVPTVDRNIYDVAKLSPMVNVNRNGGITINGTNNRYNSFQIDGMVANDVFGLTSSGTNGGQTGANPISLDAIDQIQISVSPFDIRQSGFTGGAINAITKSGTNKFTGTAFGYYTDESMYGRYNQHLCYITAHKLLTVIAYISVSYSIHICSRSSLFLLIVLLFHNFLIFLQIYI